MASSGGADDFRRACRRLLAAHAAHALPIHQLYSGPFGKLSDEERLEAQRHAIADALRRSGLADAAHMTIVEFGAGDGALSRTLSARGIASKFLLIDKNKRRIGRALEGTEAAMQQLCADIGILEPETLRAAAPDDTVVVVCNHLCGGALDDAIRCALAAWDSPREGGIGGGGSSDAFGGSQLAGVVSVTCCHHNCSCTTLLGSQQFLRDVCGLTDGELELARDWSRMAPRREKPAESRPRLVDMAQQLCISPDDAADLGMRCRVLLDSARALHLQQRGFSVALVHHVPNTLTADNLMILASRRRPLQAGSAHAAVELDRNGPIPCPPVQTIQLPSSAVEPLPSTSSLVSQPMFWSLFG
jgi:hypothetical protein